MTYVGMLIATTRVKRQQGGLVPGFNFIEYSANSMVLQDTGHDRDVCVWSGVCGHEDCHEDSPRDKI